MAKLTSRPTTIRVVPNAAFPFTNTVYEHGDLPGTLANQIVWPSAGAQNELYTGTDANYVYMHYGYGGSVYLPEVGPNGTMVFGYTGEATFCEQLTAFAVDTGAWSFFQQPKYAVSLAEAIATNADWYFNQTDYAALPAARKVPRGSGEVGFAAGWDRGFPVGYAGWVARRKVERSCLGNERPHWFRYGMPAYVPAAVSGLGAGAIVVNSRGTIYGPFAQHPSPAGVDDRDWFAETWPSGGRKHFLHVMNVATRQWQRLPTPIPERNRGENEIYHPQSAWDPTTRRLYYSIRDADDGVYWADFSQGIANMTWGGPTLLTSVNGANWAMLGDDGNSALCIPTSGPNAGRRLWYFKHNRGTGQPILGLVDLDGHSIYRLDIAGLPPASDVWGITFDAASNLLYLVTKGSSGVRFFRAVIPTDPTNAASYSMSVTNVALASGVVLEPGEERTKQLGQRNHFIPSLGVILLTQRTGKMLAFRPG